LRVNEFAPAPLNTSNFKDAELIGTATGPRSAPLGIPDGREAFNSLQAELLGIAERVERGEADLQELHRAAADYDALREAALASAKLH
jgi:hypothetical protein